MRIDISNRIGTTSNFGGFRGLLDKFSGAAAGYSLRKLSKSATNAVRVRRSSDNTEQDIGFTGTELDTTTLLDFVNARDVAPADYGAGAAAAYSLRYVSDSYTGDVVRVRRDSDNAEADFNPTEITDGTMLDWVNADVVKYTSDFTSGNEDLLEFNGTSTDGETIAGVSDAYKFTLSGGSANHFAYKTNFHSVGKDYSITFDVYIPSTNVNCDGVVLSLFGAQDIISTNTLDQWITLTSTYTANYALLNFFALDGTNKTLDADGDVFYLKNIVFTQLTSDGYVTTWYDQSGNSNDATQGTAASQPKIVDAGVLVEENGKPAVSFDGSDDNLVNVSISVTQPFSSIHVFKLDTNKAQIISGIQSNNVYLSTNQLSTNQIRAYAGLYDGGFSEDTNQHIFTSIFNGISSSMSLDESLQSGLNFGSNSGTGLGIGASSAALFNADVKYQELIIYNSDQSSNRGNIEANVNDYYSIYTSTNDGFVTTWYDQSGNGNDATQASASSQPKIVSAGVLVTENGKPAIQFSNDYMSTNTLISNSTEATILSVYKNNPAGIYKTIIGIGNSNGYALTTDIGKYNLFYRTVADQRTTDNAIINTQGLIFAYTKSAVNQTIYVNNTLYQNITPPSMLVPTTSSSIGAYDGNLDLYTGIQQELILYPSDQSSNRSGIESRINNYYNIY